MSIEGILRRKGTDVTTIGPEASIKSAADWLRAKNIGALAVTSGNAVLGLVSYVMSTTPRVDGPDAVS